MSSSSVDNVSVSLSRLALAKAIKTPDHDDPDAEPWTKSIIFYQSHIHKSMRETVQNPQHRMRLPPGMPRHRIGPNMSAREQPARNSQDFERNGRKPVRNERRPRPSSAQQLQPPQQKPKQRNHKAPRDCQDIQQPEIVDDNNATNDGKAISRSCSSSSSSYSEAQTPTPDSLPSSKHHRQVPSDDEYDSEDDDNDTDVETVAIERNNEHEKSAHLASTLLHLEKGSSIHQRPRSLSDIQQTNQPHASGRQHTPSTSSNEGSSTRSSGTLRANSPQRPSHNRHTSPVDLEHLHQHNNPLEIMQQQQQPPQIAKMHPYHHAMQSYVFQQQCMRPFSPPFYTPLQQPIASTAPFYHHSSNQSAPKRSSLSAMDMMRQREQDKEKADAAKRRPKKIDSSNAPIEGILARLPEKGTHNINFQATVMRSKQQQQHRTSGGDVPPRPRRSQSPHAGNSSPPPPPANRSSSILYVYNQQNTDARRRAEMKRINMDPTPKQSLSTPQSREQIDYPIAPQPQYYHHHHPQYQHQYQNHQQYAPVAYPIVPVMNPTVAAIPSPLPAMEFISRSPIPEQQGNYQQWK
ncbi:hypothetical protein VTP01DRAFT_1607 [Rhizomucor pusillus]|uniref:uncharacterized protein n=1 Tax=Rhizomucor pusillus TaxID=4840 RepID=UPI003744A8D5